MFSAAQALYSKGGGFIGFVCPSLIFTFLFFSFLLRGGGGGRTRLLMSMERLTGGGISGFDHGVQQGGIHC